MRSGKLLMLAALAAAMCLGACGRPRGGSGSPSGVQPAPGSGPSVPASGGGQ